MDRRSFVGAMSMMLAAPLVAQAQRPEKVARIGYLVTGSLGSPEVRGTLEVFRHALRERSYVEGQNIVIELRGASGKIERLPDLAAELVRLQVDLIVAGATPAARAAQRATATIPIVAMSMGDPVGDGLVVSLARPGGNITGTTFLGPALVPKRLELLKETLPSIVRVAALWHPGAFGERATSDMVRETEEASRTLGVKLQLVPVRAPNELERAFSTMTRDHADALLVFPSPMLFSERKRIVDLAVRHRLPAMFNASEFVILGGLISYGASILDLARRAATSVAKILKGARPSDLPVEQPEKFELVINLKTAKALGIAIPPSLLLRADQVIER
jgi:putative ABC transport system substrate-binding protein